jgi:hypothetical protein
MGKKVIEAWKNVLYLISFLTYPIYISLDKYKLSDLKLVFWKPKISQNKIPINFMHIVYWIIMIKSNVMSFHIYIHDSQ